jgi:hypothetical protein
MAEDMWSLSRLVCPRALVLIRQERNVANRKEKKRKGEGGAEEENTNRATFFRFRFCMT